MYRKIFYSVFALILLFPLIAFSQPCPCTSQVIGKGFGVDGGYYLSHLSSAISSNGDFFVLWRVPHPTLSDVSFQGRLFGPFGKPKSTTLEFQSPPIVPISVTYNPAENEFLMLLRKESVAANQTTFEYFTQRISAVGNLVNQPVEVAEISMDSELQEYDDSVLLFDSSRKNFLLAYLVRNANTGRLFIQRISRKGQRLGSRIFVKQDNIFHFDLKHDPIKNRFMLVWATRTNITFQILGPDLTKMGVNQIIPGSDRGLFTAIFSAKSGFFVIFWNDPDFGIIANTVDFNGAMGAPIKIGVRRVLRIARPNPVTGGFVILVDSTGILRLNPDFSVARNVFEVACVDDYLEAISSSLLYNSSRKEFIVLWIESSPNFTNAILYGMRIRAAPATKTCS